VGLQVLSLLAFFVVERFRLPWVPVLAIFAAWTLVEIFRRWRGQRRQSLRLAAACLCVGVLCNAPLWGVYDTPAFNLDYKIAYAYQQQGRVEAAMAAYRQAIAREPRAALPRNALGVLLAQRGERLDEAARWIESALALDLTYEGNFAESLAFVELQRGNPTAALSACERGLATSPDPPLRATLLLRRGEALAQLGRTREASQALRSVLDLVEEGETQQRARMLLQELEEAPQTREPGS
jgi:tetratricopeptide (TPR) repeat protein